MLRACTGCVRALRQAELGRVGLVRGFAEKADKAVASADMDWSVLERLAQSDNAKRQVASLRSTFKDEMQKLEALAPEEVTIDWDSYKGKVDDRLLTTLHKALTGLKIPKYDISGALKEVDEVFAPILKQAKELEEFSAQRAKEIEAEIAAVDRDIARLKEVTIEDEIEKDPELAAKIDDEISKGSYY
ncbi:hypothetical protein WJX81_005100 [Elliptochloris bilobata]|uniref:ATP synthase subunit d, mitochondrial n=1 Tax=Elliptochloris bilobata TaxID=381761 RepID=A0AAW1QHL2_9CHLO